MSIQRIICNVFTDLSDALEQITEEQYRTPSHNISNATIGQHVRHIIELFQCMVQGYDLGTVNYDQRKRDIKIEIDKSFAFSLLNQIEEQIQKENKELILVTTFGSGEEYRVNSNFFRELIYNLEHAIHHMALIRVGLNEVAKITLPDTFGVAPSTIEYRKICAQ